MIKMNTDIIVYRCPITLRHFILQPLIFWEEKILNGTFAKTIAPNGQTDRPTKLQTDRRGLIGKPP